MQTHIRRPIVAGPGILCLVFAAAAATASAQQEEPRDVAELFFELNNTDGDLGIHADIDGGPWKYLAIEDINEREILVISARSRLRRQGMTQLEWESAEPPFDELTPAQFFRRFPEGTYEVEGVTLDGDELESEVEISHVLAGSTR